MAKMALQRNSACAANSSTAAVITVCTHRKRAQPPIATTPVSLPIGSQDAVQTAWIEKIRTAPTETVASDLYAGRGFGLAVEAAKMASGKLYILSAGLGLVAGDQQVPVYGLTVSGAHAESVSSRVTGRLDVSSWFSGLLSSPYSEPWSDVMSENSGRILIALTRPYARMVGQSLSKLEPQALARLRIFGASLATDLPACLHPALAPYDDRLNTIFPGTCADFPQRALLHFVRSVAISGDARDRKADNGSVEAALRGVASPDKPRRPRRTDQEILQLITMRLRSQSGIAQILRALRDYDGVACEQSRFSRLYRTALEQREMA